MKNIVFTLILITMTLYFALGGNNGKRNATPQQAECMRQSGYGSCYESRASEYLYLTCMKGN